MIHLCIIIHEYVYENNRLVCVHLNVYFGLFYLIFFMLAQLNKQMKSMKEKDEKGDMGHCPSHSSPFHNTHPCSTSWYSPSQARARLIVELFDVVLPPPLPSKPNHNWFLCDTPAQLNTPTALLCPRGSGFIVVLSVNPPSLFCWLIVVWGWVFIKPNLSPTLLTISLD